MDGYEYIIDSDNHAYLEDGGVLIIIGDNISASRDMLPYGPKTGVIAYGTFLSAVGVFIDVILIIALCKTAKNIKGTSRLLLGLLIAIQITALLFVVPFEVAREYLGTWCLGKISCRIWTILSHICVPIMLWLCVAISLDRICHIRTAAVYSSHQSGYKTPCLITAALVFSVTAVAPLICWMSNTDFILDEVCAVMVDKVYTSVLTALCYFIPAVICLIMNVALSVVTTKKIKHLRNLGAYQQESQTALDPKSKCSGLHIYQNSSYCRSTHNTNASISAINNSRWSVIALSLSCIILWAPFYIINLKITFCQGFCLDPRMWALLQWIGYSYYIVGPCLYFVDKRLVQTVKSWVNGSNPADEIEYSKSVTESDYSARSGFY